ncbi:MAG TPA: zf-HC2 domain-containing protein, partial [Candidatus Limnocylindrales bacterium]
MTDEHARALDLAAASIDFELNEAEQAVLDGHLASCSRCRRRAFALREDQRALENLPRYAPTQAVSDQVVRTLRRGGRSPAPTFRLLLAASLVALLALSSIVIGAGYLRREPPPDLSVVPSAVPATPGPTTPDPTQAPAASSTPSASPTPSPAVSDPP